jgi:hypothetical protein
VGTDLCLSLPNFATIVPHLELHDLYHCCHATLVNPTRLPGSSARSRRSYQVNETVMILAKSRKISLASTLTILIFTIVVAHLTQIYLNSNVLNSHTNYEAFHCNIRSRRRYSNINNCFDPTPPISLDMTAELHRAVETCKRYTRRHQPGTGMCTCMCIPWPRLRSQ